jgi:hypothetical protein
MFAKNIEERKAASKKKKKKKKKGGTKLIGGLRAKGLVQKNFKMKNERKKG